jgi:hypothetical protein
VPVWRPSTAHTSRRAGVKDLASLSAVAGVETFSRQSAAIGGAVGALHTPTAWHRLPARLPKLGLFAAMAAAAALHCAALQALVPLHKLLKAAAMLALVWVYSCVTVKAAICVRQPPQTAQGVRTQPLYFVQVSPPDSGSQMHTAPVDFVTSHIRSGLSHCQSSRQAPAGSALDVATPGTLQETQMPAASGFECVVTQKPEELTAHAALKANVLPARQVPHEQACRAHLVAPSTPCTVHRLMGAE